MFDVKEEKRKIINFIQSYYKENNLKGAVIGISGGKDSAVVAALFKEALGSSNVEGIWMSCNSNEKDYEHACLLCNKLNINLNEFDLSYMYEEYVSEIKRLYNVSCDDLIDANINIKPRLRMSTLYYHAQMFSKIKGGTYIVPGTSNKCELFVGYFTKGGDSVSDIQVLSDLTVDEVIKLGEYLNIPDEIIHKIPDDGLSGKTDEEKLGVTYQEISDVINNKEIDKDTKRKVLNLHNNAKHKYNVAKYER